MSKHLDLLLDLLGLEGEQRQSFLAIGQVIEHNTKRTLIVYHRMGFVFQAFYDLLLEHISLEEFLSMGDISSSHPLYKPNTISSLELLSNMKNIKALPKGSMVVVDEVSFFVLSEAEQLQIKEELEKVDILLLLC